MTRLSKALRYCTTALLLAACSGAPPAAPAAPAVADGLDAGGTETPLLTGVYSLEQADRGEQAYVRSCARCHGPTLDGGEQAPALRGDDFLRWWYGEPLSALDEIVEQTMPADNPAGLSRRAYVDLLAYMLSQNGYPAGSEPLADDRDVLAGITIQPPASE